MNKKWPGCEILIPHLLLVDFNKLSKRLLTNRKKDVCNSFTKPPLFPLQTDSYLGWGRIFFLSRKYFKVSKVFTLSPDLMSPQITSDLWQRSWYHSDLDLWIKSTFLVPLKVNNWSPSFFAIWQCLSCGMACICMQLVHCKCFHLVFECVVRTLYFLIKDLQPGGDSCCD